MPAPNQPVTTRPEFFPLRMRTGQAARYLGLSRRYLQQLSAAGRVPFHRLGKRCVLYSRSDLDAFLEETRIDAGNVSPRRAEG